MQWWHIPYGEKGTSLIFKQVISIMTEFAERLNFMFIEIE